MPIELLIVRHGETVWNEQARIQGQQDPPLTPTGLQQAHLVAEALRDSGAEELYTSDLDRARRTAEAVAGVLGLGVVERPELREIGMGAWEGLTSAEAQARDPAQHARWQQDSIRYRPPGGETYEQLLQRVQPLLREIEEADTTAVVVTHYSTGRALLTAALRGPLASVRWFRLDNASLSRLRRTGTGAWQLTALNDTSHLRARPDSSSADQ